MELWEAIITSKMGASQRMGRFGIYALHLAMDCIYLNCLIFYTDVLAQFLF